MHTGPMLTNGTGIKNLGLQPTTTNRQLHYIAPHDHIGKAGVKTEPKLEAGPGRSVTILALPAGGKER